MNSTYTAFINLIWC